MTDLATPKTPSLKQLGRDATNLHYLCMGLLVLQRALPLETPPGACEDELNALCALPTLCELILEKAKALDEGLEALMRPAGSATTY